MSDKGKTRSWCWTLNNPVATGDEFKARLEDVDGLDYAIFQKEKGLNGTVHFQGFVRFTNALHMGGVKVRFGEPTLHLERMRGSISQAMAYCEKKDETYMEGPWEVGTKPSQGARNDLVAFQKCVEKGEDTWEERFLLTQAKYPKLENRIILNLTQKIAKAQWENKEFRRQVHVYYGETGSGKTLAVWQKYAFKDIWTASYGSGTKKSMWFDGYTGQKVALFDDYYGWFAVDLLLRLTDRYPVKVQTKGGEVWFVPEEIYFTSNDEWKTWYHSWSLREQRAMERRITEVKFFENERKREASEELEISQERPEQPSGNESSFTFLETPDFLKWADENANFED